MAKHDINAFLGTGTAYQGRLTFHGTVRIDGEFEGEIASDGTLIVGQGARITGRIAVGQFLCGGRVAAEVTAAGKIVLHKTAVFTGSLSAPSLVVEEGAAFAAEVAMDRAAPEPALESGDRPAADV